MGRFVGRMRDLALAWGAPGLFVVGLLDSFLPLPGITDVLLIVLVTRNTDRVLLYVVAATLGSLAGCMMLYEIGRKGGEALVRQRFATDRIERTMRSLQRHGLIAVLIPTLLPPPSPLKAFVLLAGAAGISHARFAAAVALGRGARFLALGLLAVRFGRDATTYMQENGTVVSLVAVGVLLAGFGLYIWWSKAQRPKTR